MLAYTLERLMTQQAVLQRDEAVPDAYGAETTANWQTLATVACRHWWWKESARGPAREVATPVRTVAFSEGGMLLPKGTDVTDQDRILQVNNPDGSVIDGPLVIQAVFDQGSHIQISWRRP